MNHLFGDLNLFDQAFAENWSRPSVERYLYSADLSAPEVVEVLSLFEVFRAAIDNASEAALPNIAGI